MPFGLIFNPMKATNGSLTLSVTATSAVTTLPAGEGPVLRLANEGPNTAYVTWGGATITALATATGASLPILAGATELFTIDPASTSIAAVCATAAGTANLKVTRGVGW